MRLQAILLFLFISISSSAIANTELATCRKIKYTSTECQNLEGGGLSGKMIDNVKFCHEMMNRPKFCKSESSAFTCTPNHNYTSCSTPNGDVYKLDKSTNSLSRQIQKVIPYKQDTKSLNDSPSATIEK